MFQDFDGPTAKRMSHKIKIRDDCHDINLWVMHETLKEKFTQNPELKEKLIATGDVYLEKGNTWHDTFLEVSLTVREKIV